MVFEGFCFGIPIMLAFKKEYKHVQFLEELRNAGCLECIPRLAYLMLKFCQIHIIYEIMNFE